MKHAVSVSLGSSTRDKVVDVELLGVKIRIERIGTDGDEKKAKELYQELDGKVDAFGVGGIDLGVHTPWRDYPLHGAKKLVKDVQYTPYVDGGGLKATLESQVADFIEEQIGEYIQPKTALLVAGITRYGMSQSFLRKGYKCTFGDLMFSLGIPIPLKGEKTVEIVARLLLPIVGRMPISMLYPTGEKQLEVTPKFQNHYRRNVVVAGDWLYIKQHIPKDVAGKVIVTNTTTEDDLLFLTQRGVKYLVTTTPVMEGRTFGVNMLEAALVALSGKNRPLTRNELKAILARLDLKPQLRELT